MGLNDSLPVVLAAAGVTLGTPLVFAAIGELLAERSGVINLGVEGMMLMGAVTGIWAVQRTPGPAVVALAAGILAAAFAGAAVALIHAFVSISLRATQILSGLALGLFAGGLSSYLGDTWNLSDVPAAHQFQSWDPFGLQRLPIIGPIFFDQSILVYGSWACVALVAVYISRTTPGLKMTAVGQNPAAADRDGVHVTRYRYIHVLVGGAFAGVAGACFTLWLSPQWVGGGLVTGGAGWIAIALVIFGGWRPLPCLLGAYLFGALTALPPNLQARGISIAPGEVFQALPYIMTIVVLVVTKLGLGRRRGAPAALGAPYVREER
jgi:ABC-type uncharacterized transport system permease subunit